VVWFYYILLALFCLTGVVLSAFMLPGLWLMVAASAVYALLTRADYVGHKALLALFLLALTSEILEIALSGAAAKAAGGSRRAVVGGIIGGILGGIFLSFIPIPILSTVAGICLGSFLGAAGFELLGGENPLQALRVGVGAASGRFMGIVVKILIGMAMLLLTLIAAWP
jgi:uncharacterized protein YqgC (DUF456 family)